METSIVDFNQKFYMPAIQKLALHVTHVHILGTHNFGNTFSYVLCRRDYAERVLASFLH